jgi:hypothetical protein
MPWHLETHRTAQSALSSAFMVKNVFKITRIAAGVSFHGNGNFDLNTIVKMMYKKYKWLMNSYRALRAYIKILPRISVPGISMSVRPCVRVSVLVANGSLELAAPATVLQAILFD